MKKAREAYGLSCSNMSDICGFGTNQWRLYENGEAHPNVSNANLIRVATTPSGMLYLLNLCSNMTKNDLGDRWALAVMKVKEIVDELDAHYKNLKTIHNNTYFD